MCDAAFQFNYVHLAPDFFNDFSHYKEIMGDINRQYLHMLVQYKDCNFLIPFRSGINHKHAFIFKKNELKGIDYSKVLIINDIEKYTLVSERNIPQYQHDIIVKNQDLIIRKFKKYIDDYCKFIANNDLNFYNRIGKYSTLQNFHLELRI